MSGALIAAPAPAAAKLDVPFTTAPIAPRSESTFGNGKAYPSAEVGMSLVLSSLVGGVLMATFGVFAMAYSENNRS
jgi:hypothetical protein